jgi:hypothetical protein
VRRRTSFVLGIGTSVLAMLPRAFAGDASGGARVYAGSTDTGGETEHVLSQDYNLRWSQPLTPWLALFVGYQSSDYATKQEGSPDFERTSREPLIEITYTRSGFNARFGTRDRQARGTSDADVLDVTSRYGQLFWKPARGPRYSLRFDESTNVADVAIFGRDLRTRTADFDVVYPLRHANLRYSFENFHLDNALTGYALGQRQHSVRGTMEHRFLDDRLSVSSDILFRRTDQTTQAPIGQTIATPLAAREGLFALDTTPDLGSLDPEPTLLDGDSTTPAVPRIDIGGANTYRNIGVDLGVTQQASRLEISVDALSDPGLGWVVYHGPDNLTWDLLGGVAVAFDPTFLRYTLTFPQTTDRYFKAVNVAANSQPIVAVTEVRAFVDIAALDSASQRSTTERAYVIAGYKPTDRLTTRLSAAYNNDGGSGDQRPVLNARELDLDALVNADLTGSLDGRIQYHRSNFRREQGPLLRRDEERYDAALLWTPLPTVDGLLGATWRDETEGGTLIRSTESVRARAVTELLPGLKLASEVTRQSVRDPFAGFAFTGWFLKETLEGRPTERMTLRGGGSSQWFDATGRLTVRRRVAADAGIAWTLTEYVVFDADWSYGDEDGRVTLWQSYSASWNPGPRLSVTAAYNESDSIEDLVTSGASASLDYRLDRYLSLFAAFSRSELKQALVAESRVTSLQFGLSLGF